MSIIKNYIHLLVFLLWTTLGVTLDVVIVHLLKIHDMSILIGVSICEGVLKEC